MSLFPALKVHVPTISQPEPPPTSSPDDKNKISFGRRIIVKTKKLGMSRLEVVKKLVRSVKRYKRVYTFWLLVLAVAAVFVYVTNDFSFTWANVDQSRVYRRSEASGEVNKLISGSEDFVVEQKIENNLEVSRDVMPELPVQPPAHAHGRPLILHYLWCGKRLFEFRHYLSMKSALRVVAPYKILFHYVDLPLEDSEGYFKWFNQTLDEVPGIILNKMQRTTCPTSDTNRFMLILDILYEYGGIYVPEDTLIINLPVMLRTTTFASNVEMVRNGEYKDGLIIAQAKQFDVPKDSHRLDLRLTAEDPSIPKIPRCLTPESYEQRATNRIVCLKVQRMIFPKDIWMANTKFAITSRVIAYNTITILPNFDLSNPFPKIAHFICVGTCEIEFIGFISMLSAIFIAKLDRVYIHGPESPTGTWWVKLQEDARFVYVKHTFSSNDAENLHIITKDPCPLRLEILLRYGGIYQDNNVLWTNAIPDYYFGYDAVVSPDWHLYGNWPESINPSILMGKAGSKYLTKLHEAVKSNIKMPNWFVDHYSAYKIIEMDPGSVYIDRRLQVKCLNHNCHPTWLHDYRSEIHQNKPGSSFDWRNDTLSVHWDDSVPALDLDMVKYLSGTPVEIARQVFQAAKIDVNTLSSN